MNDQNTRPSIERVYIIVREKLTESDLASKGECGKNRDNKANVAPANMSCAGLPGSNSRVQFLPCSGRFRSSLVSLPEPTSLTCIGLRSAGL
jgi:hypothetical protein